MNPLKLHALVCLLLTLTACKIDLSVIGLGTVKTESGSVNCATGTTGDCTQSYVTDVTQCPGYVAPAQGVLPVIPANCTVLVATSAMCSTSFSNGIAWQNCIPDDNGLEEAFHAQSTEGNAFVAWGGDNIGCGGQTGRCTMWISPDNASTSADVAVTATFEPDVEPQTASYTYNHLGQRFSKTVGAATTYFIYSAEDGQLLGEYSATGAPIRQYILVDGERVGMFNYSSGSKQVVYFGNNHLGQPVVAWNSAGEQVFDRIQSPFGETMGEYAVANFEIPVRFPGQYYDSETGFNQNWNRDYDSSTGRYVQSDPIGLRGGINTYAYVGNNPVMFVDPDGLSPSDVTNIVNTYNQTVKNMTNQGYRTDPGWYNNIASNFPGNNYLGCGDQCSVVNHALNNGSYDDHWTFVDIPVNGGLHHRSQGTSGNPNDPVVTLDPQGGKPPQIDYPPSSMSTPNVDPKDKDAFCRDNPDAPNCKNPCP